MREYNNYRPGEEITMATFEAVKRIRNYSGSEYKGKELGQQLGIKWL